MIIRLFTKLAGRALINPIVKSIGSVIIAGGLSSALNKIPVSQANNIQQTIIDDSGHIIKGKQLTQAILPLRKTKPSEITQIIQEAATLQETEPSFSRTKEFTRGAKTLIENGAQLFSNLWRNEKRIKLQDSEIQSNSEEIPGITIGIRKAIDVYQSEKIKNANDKVLTLNLSLKNAANMGFVFKIIKFAFLTYVLIKSWNVIIWITKKIKDKIIEESITDVDYVDLSRSPREQRKKQQIQLNPANYYMRESK